jgi:hypothetical protein
VSSDRVLAGTSKKIIMWKTWAIGATMHKGITLITIWIRIMQAITLQLQVMEQNCYGPEWRRYGDYLPSPLWISGAGRIPGLRSGQRVASK